MFIIETVQAHEVLDSRGFPTVMAQVTLTSGLQATSMVPSGASTGSQEALALRDNDPKRFQGKGVLRAIQHIHECIAPALKGKIVTQQAELDHCMLALDGTTNKENLGANAILAVSLACARLAAKTQKVPLFKYLRQLAGTDCAMPVPLLNILNGGAHADNGVDIQEFMILPLGAPDFATSLRYGVEVYHSLKSVLKKKGLNVNVGDEGGFAPSLPSNEAALEYILLAIEQAGLEPGKEIYLALDIAASEFYHANRYHLTAEKKSLTAEEWIDMLASWAKTYPILSIEDGMDEKDYLGWQQLTQRLGNQLQLVGDDLFVTHPVLFKAGVEKHLANAILIKPNQIGTLSETLDTVSLAKQANYNVIVSHRSGETEDTFIADLAVALGEGQIKTGAPCRSDRTAKYNRLLHIISETDVPFHPKAAFQQWLV